MFRRLRKLLVATAALATVLAGFRGSFAAAGSTEPLVCSLSMAPVHDSREDDAGTRSEQVEEEDTEEQDGREIHLVATTVLAGQLDSAVRSGAPVPSRRSSSIRCRATHARGPPRVL